MPDPHFWTSFNLNYLFTRLYLQIVIRLQHLNFGSETIESITDGESKAWSRKSIKREVLVAQLCPTLGPHGLQPTGLLCPWDFPGKDTGVGATSFFKGSSQPRSLALQADALPTELRRKPRKKLSKGDKSRESIPLVGEQTGWENNHRIRVFWQLRAESSQKHSCVHTGQWPQKTELCMHHSVQPLEERISIQGQRPGLTTGAFCVTEFYWSIREREKASDIDIRRGQKECPLASFFFLVFSKVFYVC